MRHFLPRQCSTRLLVTAGLVTGLSGAAGSAAVIDTFESPTNSSGTALSSGTDVASYNSAMGKWSDANTGGASTANNIPELFNLSGDGYGKSNWFLRQIDSSATSTGTTLALNAASTVAANGTHISFALRDDASMNNNQVTIQSNSNSAGNTRLLQIGLQNTGTNTGKISATTWNGAGSTATANSPATLIASADSGRWYFFDIAYSIAGTVGSYTLTITESAANQTDASTVVYPATGQTPAPLVGNAALLSSVAYSVTSITTATASAAQGTADVDSVALPEPGTASLVCIGGAGIMLKRRRRQKAGAIG